MAFLFDDPLLDPESTIQGWFDRTLEASAAGSANATGSLPTVTLSAAAGSATGAAEASGAGNTVTLTSAAGAGASPGDASGDLPTVNVTPPSATASGAIGHGRLLEMMQRRIKPGEVEVLSMPTVSISAPEAYASTTTALLHRYAKVDRRMNRRVRRAA